MSTKRESLEIKVGIFVFAGLAVLAALVVQFGRLGEGFRGTYEFTVEFPNASGLVREANVLLAGARIGRTASGPEVLPDGSGVSVQLRIYDNIEIPVGSTFQIGSSGLLGDRFVDVLPNKEDRTKFIEAGAIVKGKREAGISDLTRDGSDLVGDLRGAVKNLNTVITRLDQEMLTEEMFSDLKQAIANLNKTTANFATLSEKLDGVVEQAGDAMGSAKKVFESADTVMQGASGVVDTTGKAAADLRLTLQDARKAVNQLNQVLTQVSTGEGAVPTLLGDPNLAAEMRALVSNLRRSGVLFYRDRSGLGTEATSEDAPDSPSPARRPTGPPGKR